MSYTQISITLPVDVLKATDARAKELDRARSWVIAEALRVYLRGGGTSATATRQVSEPAAVAYVAAKPGVGAYRLAQLEADLALTPEQRVREADRTARDAERLSGRTRPAGTLIAFDRFEDYLRWQRWESIG